MEVTTIRRKGDAASGGWSVAGGRGDWRESWAGSQPAPRSCREQLTTQLVEIGQGKHGLRPRQVLGQAAVSHFVEAPQMLDHPKRMLAAGAGPRAHSVDHPPAFAQRPARRSPIDPIAHPARGERLAVGFLPVRLIAKNLPLLA